MLTRYQKIYGGVFFLVISVLVISGIYYTVTRDPWPEATYTVKRHIRYGFTLQNKTNQLLENVDFWAYGPVKQTSVQLTKTIKASLPYTLLTDQAGNQILHFVIDKLPPYGTQVVTIEANLLLAIKPNVLPETQLQSYLAPEKYIETNDPRLITLAGKLKTQDPTDTARKTLNWVHRNIRYAGYVKDDRGAAYAMKTRKGDCTEYMYLYTALTRINGLPTRGVGGYVYREDSVLKAKDFHNWSEVYLDKAWRVIDPQKGNFMQDPHHYIAMRIISEKESQKMALGNTHRFMTGSKDMRITMN